MESIQPRPPRPAKPEDRKGGEGKADANLTIFLSTCRTDRPRRGMALSCFLSVAFGFEATGELGELEARNGARPSNCSPSDLLFPLFAALCLAIFLFNLGAVDIRRIGSNETVWKKEEPVGGLALVFGLALR